MAEGPVAFVNIAWRYLGSRCMMHHVRDCGVPPARVIFYDAAFICRITVALLLSRL